MRIRPLGLYRQCLQLGFDPTPNGHQGSEPSKGVRSLGLTVAAIVYHAPQVRSKLLPRFALPKEVSLE
jgi:hypothetical protein